MASAKVNTTVEYTMTLSEREAKLIMALVQNPYTVEDPIDEPEDERQARQSIWKSLESVGLLDRGVLP